MAELDVYVNFHTERLDEGMKRANQKVGTWVRGVENASGKTKTLGSTIATATDNVKSFGNQFESTLNKVGQRLAAYSTIWAAIGISRQIVEITGQFQQLRIAFETMLDSKEKADRIMAESIALAQKTPFTLMDVTTNAKQLMAMGVSSEKVMKAIKSLGDVAAGVSVPLSRLAINYGQVLTLGRLQQREIRDFAMAGVPLVAELAKNMGKTTEEIQNMVSAGKVGFKDVEKAFQTMSAEGGKFYNLMEKQNKSITGQISNLVDKWQVMMDEIGSRSTDNINAVIKSGAYLIEHYKTVLDILGAIIRTYGAYRAAAVIVGTIQAAGQTTKLLAEGAALSKILTTKQQLQIADAKLIKGSLDYAKATTALISKEETFLKKTIDTNNNIIAKQTLIVNKKKAEVVTSNELLVKRDQELVQAVLIGKEKKIEAARRNSNAAATKLEAVTKQQATAQNNINTASESVNTASIRLNTISKERNAAATGMLASAQLKLNRVMAVSKQWFLANQYTLALAAVIGLAYGIYKLATADSALEKAQKKLNESLKEGRELKADMSNDAESLVSTIRDETKGIYAQVKAYDELIKRFAFFSKYTQKEIASMSEDELNRLMASFGIALDRDMAQKAYDNQKKVIDELNEKQKYDFKVNQDERLKAEKIILEQYYQQLAKITETESKAFLETMDESYYEAQLKRLNAIKSELTSGLMAGSGNLTPLKPAEGTEFNQYTQFQGGLFPAQMQLNQVDRAIKQTEARLRDFRTSDAVKNYEYWNKIYKDTSDKLKEFSDAEIGSEPYKAIEKQRDIAKAKMDLYEEAAEKAKKTDEDYLKSQQDVIEKVGVLDAKFIADKADTIQRGYQRDVEEIKAGGAEKLAALEKEYSDLRQKMASGEIVVTGGVVTGKGMSAADLAKIQATLDNFEAHKVEISKKTNEELRQLEIDRNLEIKDLMEGMTTYFASEMDKQIADANRKYDNDLIRLKELGVEQARIDELERNRTQELINIKAEAAIKDIDFNEQMATAYIENGDKEYFFETTKQRKLLNVRLKYAKERLQEVSKINTKEAKQEAIAIGEELKGINKELANLSLQEVAELGDAFSSIGSSLQNINPQLAQTVSAVGDIFTKVGGIKEAFSKSKIEGIAASFASVMSAFDFVAGMGARADQKSEEKRLRLLERQLDNLNKINDAIERGGEISEYLYGTDKIEAYNTSVKNIVGEINNLKTAAVDAFENIFSSQAVATVNLFSSLFSKSTLQTVNNFEKLKRSIKDIFATDFSTSQGAVKALDDLDSSLATNKETIDELVKTVYELQELGNKKGLNLVKQDELNAALQAIDSLTAIGDKLYQIREELMQQVTGVGFSSMVDDMVSMFEKGFENFDTLAADSADNFQELMRKAILASFKAQALEQPLRDWYENFAEFSASNGSLNEKEIAKLRAQYNDIINNATKEFETMKDIAGGSILGTSTTSQTGLAGQIRAELTEATGTELAGIFRSTRDDGRKSLDTMRIGVSHLARIEQNTGQTVIELQRAIVELQGINKNTKGVYTAAL